MTIADWLAVAAPRLAGIDSARLDCLLLLEDLTKHDRAWLLAHDDNELDEAAIALLDTQLNRRAAHEPLAYIRGTSEFYGRRFLVGPEVLVPRPESEAMVTRAKELPAERAADIGSGSGCLGISLKLERPGIEVTLSDSEAPALALAARNAHRLRADVTVRQSDLLSGLAGRYDLLLTNLPYVPEDYPINKAATFEPKTALFSGADGMDHYRRFWRQVASARPRFVITEALTMQHEAMRQLAADARYGQTADDGLAQSFEAR